MSLAFSKVFMEALTEEFISPFLIRPMTTKFDKQVHLGKLTQIRLIKQGLETSSC